MFDWAALGLFALQKSADIAIEEGKNVFKTKAVKLKEKFVSNIPSDNNQLAEARRRAFLITIRNICSRRKSTSGESGSSFLNKIQNFIYINQPVGILSQPEQQRLINAEKYIETQIQELDNDEVYTPRLNNAHYQELFTSNNFKEKDFSKLLINDVIAELKIATNSALPNKFEQEIQQKFVDELSIEFQHIINNDSYLANKFQIETLLDVKEDTTEIKKDVKELLNRTSPKSEKQNNSQAVLNLPNLDTKIYDRENETEKILQVLCENKTPYWLIVAPSNFGKTYLLTSVLQQVTDGIKIKSKYKDKVEHILVIDCQLTNSLNQIVNDFSELLGVDLYFQPQNNIKKWLNSFIFSESLKSGTIWIIFENFESWLVANNEYSFKSNQIEGFFHAILTSNHNFKLLILSQAEPFSDIRKHFKTPNGIADNLIKGLPEKDALAYLKTEGKEVALNKTDEKLLKEFLNRVHNVPQAISSLIGYLHTIGGENFESLLGDTALWEDFDNYESDSNKAERRTKALIEKQILSQPKSVKKLLTILTFFGISVSKDVLEFFFENELQTVQNISLLKSNRLATVTEDSRGTNYYKLHLSFQETTQKVLPPYSNIVNEQLVNKMMEKAQKLVEQAFFSRALNLLECAEIIFKFLQFQRLPVNLSRLFGLMMDKATIKQQLGKINEAITEYDKAIFSLDNFIKTQNIEAFKDILSKFHLNKSEALRCISYFDEAEKEINKSIVILENLINIPKYQYLKETLGTAYSNKGIILSDMGITNNDLTILDKATNSFTKSNQILEDLKEKKLLEDQITLASSYTFHAVNLDRKNLLIERFEDSNESINLYEKALNVLESYPADNLDKLHRVSLTYLNMGVSILNVCVYNESKENLPIAKEFIENALDGWRDCLKEGYLQILPEFLTSLRNLVLINSRLDDVKAIADNLVETINKESYTEDENVEDYHKEQMHDIFSELIFLISTIPDNKLDEIYEAAGKSAKKIKEYVDEAKKMNNKTE